MQTKRKIQTTSTKCQYHMAHSKPTWWLVEKCARVSRTRQINKKVVPIMTCSPWKPVATKKVLPYTLSAMVKGASQYS